MNSKEYKYVIGLDLSLTEPGWAKYDLDKKELTFGVVDVGKTKGFDRISKIRNRVNQIVDAIYSRDDYHENSHINDISGNDKKLVIIEGYSFASKGNSAISLGELGGVVRMMFYENDITYYECAPTQLKKFVSGKGTSGKEIILRDMYKNFQIEVDNNNAADAIGLCYIGLTSIGKSDKKVTKDQQAIADKVVIND